MLSTLQICLLSISGVFALASIVFTIMFFVEISVREKKTVKKISIKKVIEENKNKEEETQISVDEMLENLEKQSSEDVQNEENETEEVAAIEIIEAQDEIVEEAIEEPEEAVEEVAEESAEEVTEESAEEPEEQGDETIAQEKVTEEKAEEATEEVKVIEEVTEEPTEEVAEESVKEVETVAEETVENEEKLDDDDDDDDEFSYVKIEPEVILAPGTVIDYKARLEKVIESKGKLEKDLAKIQKFILKYERTDRRMARNQKMLDRRAGELTNLNLLMYSVTDIKNVDEDKKIKQEELTTHIAELKASIQDAEEYLESNKEKYHHNQKMAKFLSQERVRFIEEIAELEALIKTAEENN